MNAQLSSAIIITIIIIMTYKPLYIASIRKSDPTWYIAEWK